MTGAKISDLIRALGDENVGIQNLDSAAARIDFSLKRGTTISFGTNEEVTPDGTKRLGVVVWLPRDKVEAALRAAEIDAKFTEREKTVRMGRDPADEARREAMVDRFIAEFRREQSSANPTRGMSRPFAHRLLSVALKGDAT